MRKQYHFMPSQDGLLAWDVGRLIQLSASLPRIQLDPGTVDEIDQVYWFDDDAQRPTCRSVLQPMQLIEECDLACPVILGQDGRVMDGMHRVAKALLQKRTTIDAVQFTADPRPDYIGVKPSDLPY